MKNLFKIVLPAFALMLAITASLAFTSNNSMEDDATADVLYQPTLSTCAEELSVEIENCQLTPSNTLCKINIPEVGIKTVFEHNASTVCDTPYYRPQ